MRFSSVDALFEAPPRRSLPSNLSQLGIGRRANKKPRLFAGQGCVGSDTKLLCMRFCSRTGSTPRHPNTLSLFRYQYKDDFAPSRRPALSTKHFLFRLQIKGIPTWRRSYAFSTMIRSMDIQNPTTATISPKSNIILAVKRCRRRRLSTSSRALCLAACPASSASANILTRMATLSLSPPIRTGPDQCLSGSFLTPTS